LDSKSDLPSATKHEGSRDNDPSVAVLEGTTPEVVVQEGAETFGEDPSTKSWSASKELLREACNMGITLACLVFAE
jgi:hypothetical protein